AEYVCGHERRSLPTQRLRPQPQSARGPRLSPRRDRRRRRCGHGHRGGACDRRRHRLGIALHRRCGARSLRIPVPAPDAALRKSATACRPLAGADPMLAHARKRKDAGWRGRAGCRLKGMARSMVVVAAAYGGPEVLQIVEQQVADPGRGEILLEVRAAGVNPVDWKTYSGARGSDPSALPMRLGMEASGIVAAIGPDAVGPAGPLTVADEVIAYRIAGAYAERVVVPASAAVPKPREVSFELAGGLMLAGATAIHALAAIGAQAGETLLVHAASGAVGRIAVQVARARGIRVIGTA